MHDSVFFLLNHYSYDFLLQSEYFDAICGITPNNYAIGND